MMADNFKIETEKNVANQICVDLHLEKLTNPKLNQSYTETKILEQIEETLIPEVFQEN